MENKSKMKNLTKRDFEFLLKKAAQPLKESSPKGSGTSAAHPSDDCSGKRKYPDNLEGREGLPSD